MRTEIGRWAALCAVVATLALAAVPASAGDADADPGTSEAVCLMIESAARAQNLPLQFFARVIWQEYRFHSDAVGPVTAGERRLLDPLDPVQALPKSAEFLNELRQQFGNLGLAAAAYHSGARQVQDWLDRWSYLPEETREYVAAITGITPDDWAAAARNGKTLDNPPDTRCGQMTALLRRAPNRFVSQLQQRVKLGADKPWGVQLAAGFDRGRALSSYARNMKRLRAVIRDRDPTLLSSLFRSRGSRTFYRVRIGVDTRTAADDLCNRIRIAGEACLVLRNRV